MHCWDLYNREICLAKILLRGLCDHPDNCLLTFRYTVDFLFSLVDPDNCVVVPSLCPNAGDGERCNTTTQRCVCRPGWSGSHPNCTRE